MSATERGKRQRKSKEEREKKDKESDEEEKTKKQRGSEKEESLWQSTDPQRWKSALEQKEEGLKKIAEQKFKKNVQENGQKLLDLRQFCGVELPNKVRERKAPKLQKSELIKVLEFKHLLGAWRPNGHHLQNVAETDVK